MRLPDWLAALLNRRMLICVATGFSSGLPLYLLLNLLPAWLYTEGISLRDIGAMTLIQLPYTWKFLWAPLLDRYALPGLGRRRGWMLSTQARPHHQHCRFWPAQSKAGFDEPYPARPATHPALRNPGHRHRRLPP